MQLDSFLKLKGQKGPSTDGGKVEAGSHFEEFEILSFQHGTNRSETAVINGESMTAPLATHHQIHVLLPITAECCEFFKAICTSKKFEEAVLCCRGSVQEGASDTLNQQGDLYKLTVKDAVVSRVQYAANPMLHRFGRRSPPPPGGPVMPGQFFGPLMALEIAQAQQLLAGEFFGPLMALELLYFGKATWNYGSITKEDTPGSFRGAN